MCSGDFSLERSTGQSKGSVNGYGQQHESLGSRPHRTQTSFCSCLAAVTGKEVELHMLVQERPLPDQSRRTRARVGCKNIHGRRLDSETLSAERPLYRGQFPCAQMIAGVQIHAWRADTYDGFGD